MPRRMSEVGEGTDDSINGVYGLIRDLLVEGKDARFVNRRGRYVLNWSRALDRYADYKARKNPHFKSKNLTRRKASNGLRSALLNFYKNEGAKEYKESKKVNDKDEVVERQFQMPPRVFESLFRNTVPSSGESGQSEQEDEREINSSISEGEIDAHWQGTPNSSDHGFDETMDLSCCDLSGSADPDSLTSPNNLLTCPNVDGFKTEEEVTILSRDAAFHMHAQMFDTSAVDSALDGICSDGTSDEISEDLDLLGVVQDICPTSGSVKGGYRFYLSLTEALSEEVLSGMAEFDGVATVPVHKLNPFTLTGFVPSSDQPGDVPVTVTTQSGQRLGMTCFQYVDEMREVAQQLVHDPAKQALWFEILCQEYGFFGTDSDLAQVLDPLNIEYQDSSTETKQQQSVKVLQLLVYTAAQTNAKQFLEMIFSTSAGRIVFDSYKDRTQLPEDVARANGHNECAQYLQDLTKRLSKETECEDRPKTINWLELVKAVQNETSVSSGNESKRPGTSAENDDNTSDYFADAETSSLGSMEPDDACPSDSEEDDAANKGLKSTFGFSKPFSDDTSSNGRFLIGSASIHSPDEDLKKGLPPVDTGFLASLVSVFQGFRYTTLNNASSEGRCHKGPECLQDNNTRSSRRRYSGRKFKGILLAGALLVLVAGFMLGEDMWEEMDKQVSSSAVWTEIRAPRNVFLTYNVHPALFVPPGLQVTASTITSSIRVAEGESRIRGRPGKQWPQEDYGDTSPKGDAGCEGEKGLLTTVRARIETKISSLAACVNGSITLSGNDPSRFPIKDQWRQFRYPNDDINIRDCDGYSCVTLTLLDGTRVSVGTHESLVVERTSQNNSKDRAQVLLEAQDNSVFRLEKVPLSEWTDTIPNLNLSHVFLGQYLDVNAATFAYLHTLNGVSVTVTGDSRVMPAYYNRLDITSGSLILSGIIKADYGTTIRKNVWENVWIDKPVTSSAVWTEIRAPGNVFGNVHPGLFLPNGGQGLPRLQRTAGAWTNAIRVAEGESRIRGRPGKQWPQEDYGNTGPKGDPGYEGKKDLSMLEWEGGSEYLESTKLLGNLGVIRSKKTHVHVEGLSHRIIVYSWCCGFISVIVVVLFLVYTRDAGKSSKGKWKQLGQ